MKTIAVTGLAALFAAAGLVAVPTGALAQTAPADGPGYRYDACARAQTQRGTGGALVGASLGALAGGNVAARGNRTEGAVLGGLLGAVIGANVGRSSAACERGTYTEAAVPAPEGDDYAAGYYGYDGGYEGYRSGAYDDEDDAYVAQPVAGGPAAGECTLAESPIYLPDGRVQKRFVRVCKDGQGRYQVVD
ncbi:MAG: glycine zipper 2TM domain-containing protein [Pseudomonadota bacterium]